MHAVLTELAERNAEVAQLTGEAEERKAALLAAQTELRRAERRLQRVDGGQSEAQAAAEAAVMAASIA